MQASLFSLAIMLFALGTSRSGENTSTFPVATAIESADRVLGGEEGTRLWFVKERGKWKRFTSFSEVPEADNTVIVGKRDGKIVAIEYVEASDSGDWEISETHYFDFAGTTIAFVRHIGSFHTECRPSADAPVHDVVRVGFDSSREVAREHTVMDNRGRRFNPSSCNFYPSPAKFKIRGSLAEVAKAYNLPQL